MMVDVATPLHILAYEGNRAKVNDWMMYRDENPYVEGKLREAGVYLERNALHLALAGSAVFVIVDLVERYGMDVNVRDSYGATILHRAFRGKSKALCRALLERYGNPRKKEARQGAHDLPHQVFDINIQTSYGDTALHYAFEGDYPDSLVRSLMRLRPDLWLCNHAGVLPVHYAAEGGRLSIPKSFLKIDPRLAHAKDNEGYTPLHYAIKGCGGAKELQRLKIVQLLIEVYGVDPTTEHNRGRMFYTLWRKKQNKGDDKMVCYLLDALGLAAPKAGHSLFLNALYAKEYDTLLPTVYLYNSITLYP